MLPLDQCWTAEERGALLASVGGGAAARPLAPAGVGALLQRAVQHGHTHDALAKVLHLDSSAMIGRFIRVAQLPAEIAAAVGWGRSSTGINLTQAQEIARLGDPQAMRELARLVLEFGLSGAEVRGAVQICLRRGVPPEIGVAETVRLRPVIERRYVQLGRVTDPKTTAALAEMSSTDRIAILSRALSVIGLPTLEASIRESGYALVLEQAVAEGFSPDAVEQSLNSALELLVAEAE